MTFSRLRTQASQFANVLAAHGITPGDIVASMLPRIPELLVVILGTWRAGAIYQPLSTGFGPAAIEARIVRDERFKLLVTDDENRLKLDEIEHLPPVLVFAKGKAVGPGDGDFHAELTAQSSSFRPVLRGGND